jgi:hypothetical protein
MHGKSSRAVEIFTRDARAAYDVESFSSVSNRLAINIPLSFDAFGVVTNDKTITFFTTGSALYRTDSATGTTSLLTTNVDYIKFTLYDRDGEDITATTAVVSNAAFHTVKGMKMAFKLKGSVIKGATAEDFSSAIVQMRNKDASTDYAFDPFDPDI